MRFFDNIDRKIDNSDYKILNLIANNFVFIIQLT